MLVRNGLGLAASHRDDDFQPVAIHQRHVRMTSTRDDFPITLDGDAFTGVTKRLDQRGDGEGLRESAKFAVKRYFHSRRF